MGRKTILTVVAVLIATIGAALVFMYVKGVDDRAVASQSPIEVLVATAEIAQGENVDEAIANGKIDIQDVAGTSVLAGALAQTDTITGQIALTTIYQGEQIVQAKFGATGAVSNIGIADKQMAISVQLGDTDRVAGFVSPGSNVSVFATTQDGKQPHTGLLLERVVVIGVGATTAMSKTTTTDETGAQTVETIPATILTLSLSQADAEKVIFASKNGQLTFGLLTAKSDSASGPGVTSTNLFG